MASSNSLRTCDLCENACYVDLLDGRSVLVCDGTATDEPAHEVRQRGNRRVRAGRLHARWNRGTRPLLLELRSEGGEAE